MSHRFACTLCGDCCAGNQVVRLTGHDLKLLVVRLGLTSVGDLKTQGLISLVQEPVGYGHQIWRPRIRFRTKPLVQCPFLVNDVDSSGVYRGLCSLHPDFKPLICTLSPLSRVVDDHGDTVTEQWAYVPPVDGCPGHGRGEPIQVESPLLWHTRLQDEVAWMRWLISQTSHCPDEVSAWDKITASVEFS